MGDQSEWLHVELPGIPELPRGGGPGNGGHRRSEFWSSGKSPTFAKRRQIWATGYVWATSQILQILSLTLFEKTPILCALQSIEEDANFAANANQLILFDF